MNDEEIKEMIKKGELSKIVAVADGKPGCPHKVWAGPYSFRCGLGYYICCTHGQFPVKYKE